MLFAYAASVAALRLVGIDPVPPRILLTLLPAVIPFAFGIALAARLLATRLRGVHRWRVVIPLMCGAAIVFFIKAGTAQFVLADAILLGPLVVDLFGRRRIAGPGILAASFAVIGLGAAAVWNFNYVGLAISGHRLHDPVFRQLDQSLYRLLTLRDASYIEFFPLVSSRRMFDVLENAYVMFFTEIILMVFVLAHDRARLVRHLAAMYAIYALGILIFMIYPVAGPFLYYPESFSAGYHATTTYTLMHESWREFSAVLKTRGSVTGFGYFVGLPSLHAGLATLFQITLARASKAAFWLMLPINSLMIASTFLLGYHYLPDTVAGMLLAVFVYWMLQSPWPTEQPVVETLPFRGEVTA